MNILLSYAACEIEKQGGLLPGMSPKERKSTTWATVNFHKSSGKRKSQEFPSNPKAGG